MLLLPLVVDGKPVAAIAEEDTKELDEDLEVNCDCSFMLEERFGICFFFTRLNITA